MKLQDGAGVNHASLELQRIVDECPQLIGKIGNADCEGADDLGSTTICKDEAPVQQQRPGTKTRQRLQALAKRKDT